ncbi:GNAT family N-acetyltransferase [Halomarina salina]|uniref:GNAT family N-acetyltransferase n=1 Tax=Halomarina salina TaxID=1872699 RepID=A0ABD5RHU2_9EURY|nr:GNAT family N-acetyltransferase [Halomarina salina]
MKIRGAESADADAIREVAHRSMEASYTLSPQTIEGAVAQWYDDESLETKLDDEDLVVLVAEDDDGDVLGFSEAALVEQDGDGDLNWLHVDPDYRGDGYARRLFEATRERLSEMGASRMRGRVLRDNTAGNDFYEHLGFVKVGGDKVDIDGSDYVENIYVEDDPEELEPVTTDEGRELYIDHNDSSRATLAPFLAVYTDTNRSDRWGYYCSNCESMDVAVDTMGRIECNECGNVSKATRWDAAYM